MALTSDDLIQIRNIFNDAFEALIEPRFERIDARFEQVDARFDQMDRRFEKIEGQLDSQSRDINNLSGRIAALENDIKEIYQMVAKLQSGSITDEKFAKKNLEEKLFIIHAELITAARQAGITLPS